jgi:GDP-4-dehydro-6-deoxy-D-mannose reductase
MADLQVVCVRPFNHIGPGQSARFVVGSIARQIALIEAGAAAGPVQLGDLDSARDFTDVRDVVRAYVVCIAQCEPGSTYNVGTGVPRFIRDIVEMLVGAARVPVDVHSMPGRVRSHDVSVTQCDSSQLRRRTGWKPGILIEQTIIDTLDYWRDVVSRLPQTSNSLDAGPGR